MQTVRNSIRCLRVSTRNKMLDGLIFNPNSCTKQNLIGGSVYFSVKKNPT